MTIKQAISREPATILGFLIGVAVFLLVRYGHLDASTADELALAVVPVVGGIITRQFVTPVTSKAGAAATVDDVVAVLQQIRNALTVPEPATPVEAPAAPSGVSASQNVLDTPPVTSTIPAAPEPWTPPSLDIPPILAAMTATPAAAYVAPAAETPPTV